MKTITVEETPVCIVPVKLNTIHFINDFIHLSEEFEGTDSNSRSVNISFLKNGNGLYRSELTSYRCHM